MGWLAVHPDNVLQERVPDVDGAPTFTFGFWPPLEAERFHTIIRRGGAAEPDKEALGSEEFEKAIAAQHEHADRMVAFGVRDWSGFIVDGTEIPCQTEVVKSGGIEMRKLTAASLRVIYANKLRGELALKCYLFNTLSEAQKKTSGLRLLSTASKTGTDAPSVPPDLQSPLEKFSGSKGKS